MLPERFSQPERVRIDFLSQTRRGELDPERFEKARLLPAPERVEIGLASYKEFWMEEAGRQLDDTAHRTLELINEFTQEAANDFIGQPQEE